MPIFNISRMKMLMFYLIVLVYAKLSYAVVEKPGFCPDVSKNTFGACVIACADDSHCKDFQKCCSTGCGMLCSEAACRAGVSKVSCPQSLCRFSQCPNAPDALCRIDSCGQCKVEYYNKTTWEKISCTNAGQNLCERMRDYGRVNPLLGRYVPTCTNDGNFDSIQRMGSRIFCVDKQSGIPDFTTEKGVGQIREMNCDKKAEKTDCQLAKEAALKLPPIGRFVPSCKDDGSYADKQCHGSTGFCWCVDKNGREWFGSRRRGAVECPRDMCPAGVKSVDGCDPMICSTVSCPGHDKRKVSCRINPCGQCKAEFLDENNRKVECQTCANKRAKLLGKNGGRPLVGEYVPQCDVYGNYKQTQCWGSVGQCWCVDRISGVHVDGTMTRGTPNCKRSPVLRDFKRPVCPNGFPMLLCLRPFCQWAKGCDINAKATCRVNPCRACAVEYFDEDNKLIDCNQEMSKCELQRADAFSSKYIGLQPVGKFIPQCDKDGNYSRIQCWGSTGYCWCVDGKTGVEQELTRVRGTPNCAIKTHENLTENNSEVKPGRCPTVKPTDTCTSKCVNDKDCTGKEKCCKIGCGKTCRKPAEEQLACPNGMPFLLCLHHCQLASCPSHPKAKCTVDPCRMCKVEFKDDDGNIVNCTEGLTECQLQKAQSPVMPGSYIPQCEKDGSYSTMQCHGSTGYCWCVDQTGREIDDTRGRQRGAVNCTGVISKKVLTKCEQMKVKAEKTLLLGVKKPQCEADGSFKQVQSWEGYQWCVDENGIELLGTRVEPGKSTPNCSEACRPVLCMIYCQYGFAKDERGCQRCECARAPLKPGLCPKSPSTTGLDCNEDLECGGTLKCCQKKCSEPVIHVKPGYCPLVNTSHAGDCTSECSQDSECSGNEKCCASGCSRKCMRPAREVCPNGAPLVMCLRNMCDDDVSCPAYPQATCQMNYCGHCSVEFVFANGTIADCGKKEVVSKQKRVHCQEKNSTLYFCPSSLCKDKTCARNPKATCRVPALSCDCAVEFYDENGNEVDCLTECQRKRQKLETGPLLLGAFKPRCEGDGTYSRIQCHGSIGYCWCSSPDGTEWPGTRVRGRPECDYSKSPVRSVHVRLSLDASFDSVKDSLKDFETVILNFLQDRFEIHPRQVHNLKVTSGSIIVKFELVKYEEGRNLRNASSQIREAVLEGTFLIKFGGETMVAKPESYQESAELTSVETETRNSSSTPVLAIALGVVFGILAVILIVGILFMVRKRRQKHRGMSVNTYDSSRPALKDDF